MVRKARSNALTLSLHRYSGKKLLLCPRTVHVMHAYEELATFKAQYEGNDLDIARYRGKLKEGMRPDEEYIKCLSAQSPRRTVAVRHVCMPALGYMLLGFVTRTY